MAALPPVNREVTFFFDLVCPYAFLASRRLPAIVGSRAKLVWRPVLLGGLYKATAAPQGADGSATDVMTEAKRAVNAEDLRMCAAMQGVFFAPSVTPGTHAKGRTLTACRTLAVAPEPQVPALAAALYQTCWIEGLDLGDPQVVHNSLASVVGAVDAEALLRAANEPAAKARLRDNTDEAARLGAFGVPTMAIRGVDASHPLCVPERAPIDSFELEQARGSGSCTQLVYGQDRLHFVDALLEREWRTPAASAPARRYADATPSPLAAAPRARVGDGAVRVELFFDFSSPWAYLGYMEASAAVASVGVGSAASRSGRRPGLVPQPILLGGLFKAIGTPNVPLLAMGEAKQRMLGVDLLRWAAWWGVPIRWPRRFPIRSVLPLRVVLAASEHERHAIASAIFRAAWVDDADISDASVLRALLARFDADDLLRRASDQRVKDALRENTERAAALGACGAPTFVVAHAGDRGEFDGGRLFWGQDRFAHVLREIVGDGESRPGGGGAKPSSVSGAGLGMPLARL